MKKILICGWIGLLMLSLCITAGARADGLQIGQHLVNGQVQQLRNMYLRMESLDVGLAESDFVNRATAAKILNGLFQFQTPQESYYIDYDASRDGDDILKLAAAQVMSSTDGYIRPQDGITLEEFYCVLGKIMSISPQEGTVSYLQNVSSWAEGTMVAMDNRGWIDQAWFAGHRSDFAITMADVERIMETVFPYGYVTGGIVTGVVTNKPVVIAHDDVTLSSCYVDTVYVASTVDATTLHIQGGRVGQVVYLQDGVSRGYDNLLSTYSTTFDPSAVGRSTNLRISMDAIDGYVLQPNAQFSMNSALGPRTAAQGYQNAYVFTSGGTEMGLAGGICQTTTTVFNAALLAGLQIDARYQHAQRVSYGQLGLDAAIYQTINDLKFTNPYNAPILLDTVYDASGVLTVNLYTIEPMELPEIHMEVVQNGYTFTATRYVDGVADYTTRSTY